MLRKNPKLSHKSFGGLGSHTTFPPTFRQLGTNTHMQMQNSSIRPNELKTLSQSVITNGQRIVISFPVRPGFERGCVNPARFGRKWFKKQPARQTRACTRMDAGFDKGRAIRSHKRLTEVKLRIHKTLKSDLMNCFFAQRCTCTVHKYKQGFMLDTDKQ